MEPYGSRVREIVAAGPRDAKDERIVVVRGLGALVVERRDGVNPRVVVRERRGRRRELARVVEAGRVGDDMKRRRFGGFPDRVVAGTEFDRRRSLIRGDQKIAAPFSRDGILTQRDRLAVCVVEIIVRRRRRGTVEFKFDGQRRVQGLTGSRECKGRAVCRRPFRRSQIAGRDLDAKRIRVVESDRRGRFRAEDRQPSARNEGEGRVFCRFL